MKSADSVRSQLMRIMSRFGLELKSTDFHDKSYCEARPPQPARDRGARTATASAPLTPQRQ